MARIQENALKKNPRLRILDIRIANSQPRILNQKVSPSNRFPSIQVQKIRQDPLPASFFLPIQLYNNTLHGLSPSGGLVSSSGGFALLLCDQGLHLHR